MNWKQLLKAMLFPPTASMLILLPCSAAFLINSLLFTKSDSSIAIASYVLAFYTLLVWTLKVPYIITWCKRFKAENKFARRWQNNEQFRINISLYGTIVWNTAYALLQLGMGFWHHSFWFYSLAGYHSFLAIMCFSLANYTSQYKPGEKMHEELILYRRCGWFFLAMNLPLSLMVFFMVYWNRTFQHHPITTIALAAYTFTAFIIAIMNLIKYRKYNSPVYSASKIVSLTAACVSVLTLEATMLTVFGTETMTLTSRRIMLGATGGVISVFIIALALYMLVQSSRKINEQTSSENTTNESYR